MRRIVLIQLVALLFVSSVLTIVSPSDAGAVSASDWKAGNIIDDGPFQNSTAMSVSQIQNWLNIRLQNCDPNGTRTSELSGGIDYNGDGRITRAEYGRSKGNPAPFTCLNNYYEVPKTQPGSTLPASNYGKSTIPSGAKSAAQLIYDAGRAYNISPKVLLVKLGTESAGPLTSDTWPFKSQYTYAMGARCPDSGPGGSANCDTDYAGFSLQMREAAKLLRWYLDSMTESWWTYKKPFATNNILWNVVETGCGGSNVYIQNKATAALYTYTPYQPNSASLNAYPGTGNGCSSYGNRNFWFVYNNWFGSSYIPQVFRTSTSTRTYLLSGSSYYYIPSPELLSAYGYRSGDVGVVKSNDINALTYRGVLQRTARFGGDEIYLVDRGRKFHFTSPTMLAQYGYSIGDESSLDSNLAYTLPNGGSVSTVVNEVETNRKYFMSSGLKRHITSPTAYNTLGSPVYSTVSTTNLTRAYLRSITNGAPILASATFAKDTDGSVAGFWDGTNLLQVENAVFNTLSPGSYIGSGVSQLPKSTTPLGELVKTNDSTFYILDSKKVYSLDSSQLPAMGLTADQFSLVPPAFASKLSSITRDFVPVVRINGSSAIFLVENGEKRYVTSRRALSDYGYNLGDAINLNSRTNSYLSNSPDAVLATGSLFRIDGGSRVYLLNSKSSKVYVPSPSLLQSFGYSFKQVRSLPASALSAYPTTGTLSNFVSDTKDSTRVWLIDRGGVRRLISTDINGPDGYALDASSQLTIDNNLLITFPRRDNLTKALRAEGTNPVYIVRDGQKQWATNPTALLREGFSFSDVKTVSGSSLNSLPTGPNIN